MARLIDADALMIYCNNLKDKTIDANDIARFPAAKVWISVKDRMPCENPWESKWVLVWFGEESALHTEAPLPAKWNPNERTWWIVGFSDKYEGMKLKVTHWAPLPEPPEEVSGDD